MGAIPGFLLVHTAVIEPYLGAGAHGDLFGPGVTVQCFADDKRRRVRSPSGDEVISSTTVYCLLATVAPTGSRVQVNGRTTFVIEALRRDGGGLPTPDHLEVVCQ